MVEQGQEQPLPLEQRAQVTYDAYILGPGDGLQQEGTHQYFGVEDNAHVGL